MWLHAVAVYVCVCSWVGVCCILSCAEAGWIRWRRFRGWGGQRWCRGQLKCWRWQQGENAVKAPAEGVKLFSEEIPWNPLFFSHKAFVHCLNSAELSHLRPFGLYGATLQWSKKKVIAHLFYSDSYFHHSKYSHHQSCALFFKLNLKLPPLGCCCFASCRYALLLLLLLWYY